MFSDTEQDKNVNSNSSLCNRDMKLKPFPKDPDTHINLLRFRRLFRRSLISAISRPKLSTSATMLPRRFLCELKTTPYLMAIRSQKSVGRHSRETHWWRPSISRTVLRSTLLRQSGAAADLAPKPPVTAASGRPASRWTSTFRMTRRWITWSCHTSMILLIYISTSLTRG